jgi:hypothetical protein
MAPFKPPTCTDEYPMSGCSGHDANGSLCRLMIQSGHHSGGQHAVLWKSILLNRSLLYEANCPGLIRDRSAQTLRRHWA